MHLWIYLELMFIYQLVLNIGLAGNFGTRVWKDSLIGCEFFFFLVSFASFILCQGGETYLNGKHAKRYL